MSSSSKEKTAAVPGLFSPVPEGAMKEEGIVFSGLVATKNYGVTRVRSSAPQSQRLGTSRSFFVPTGPYHLLGHT
jgi:hypothetical protein